MKRYSLSLRARITTIVLSAFLGLIAIGTVTTVLRERETSTAMGESLLRDVRVIWRAATADTARRLAEEAARLAADPALAAALAAAAPADMRQALAPHLARLEPVLGPLRVEVLKAGGVQAFNSGGELSWRPTLGADHAARILAGESIDTIQIDWARNVVAVHARPVSSVGGAPGVLALSLDIRNDLAALKHNTDAEAMVINRRGRVLAGTAPGLWDALAGELGSAPVGMVALNGRTLSVAALPLDYPGGLSARLVLAKDVSELAERRGALQILSMVLAALATLAVVGGLSLWLKSVFRPLERAVAAINALSVGDTTVSLAANGRADEIGRMAEALERFRDQTARLKRLQDAQERQRRRQETFIHREMTMLASTLEPLAREEILRDLQDIEAEKAAGGDDRPQDGLGMMASAFRKMSVRVRQQQQHLQELINELREALKMKAAYFQLQQELDIAREIQKSMLPLDFPVDHPRIQLHATMEPAKEVGGDFYDFFFIDERRLGVVIADVSGKGVPAALFMAISRTLLKATALFGSSPARCLENLNNLLAENNEKNLFVTVFYGILDIESGTFTYCNAGHNPPYLLRPDGGTELLPRTNGMALAIMEDMPQTDAQIALAPGDSLFLFTDGVVEAQDSGNKLFEDPRLEATLHGCGGLPPDAVIGTVIQAVQDFVCDAAQFDDITCLAVRWLPSADGAAP